MYYSFPIKIRAHHLLCMQGYQGYGYSKVFENNLHEIIKCIKSNPGLLIEVIAENDLICSSCPHLCKSECQMDESSNSRIHNMDMEIIKVLGLKSGDRGKASYFINLVNSKFKKRSQLNGICGNCQWKEKCLWYSSFES
ncbi:MAG: DUF1284 domain-containing protein [Anaerocolumna sp.]